jgi:hypothetical protein
MKMPEAIADTQPEREYPITTMGIVAPIVGWLIPGGGHFIQRRLIRGVLLLISVVSMFTLGIWMNGKVYSPNTGDLLDMLSFVGDLGAGILYMLAKSFGWGRGAINTASANYGSVYIVVAGLLNIVSAVDAHQIAIGKKK